MIKFLTAAQTPGQEEELILLTALPQSIEALYAAIELTRERYPKSIIRTSIVPDEACTVELDPVNYRDRLAHYMVHIKPVGKSYSYAVYQIEAEQFRSVKKFIATTPTSK